MTGSISNLNFLIVDDNPHVCSIVDSILRSFGVRQVTAVQDAVSAHEELRTKYFDIAIIDYLMQPTGGLELTERLRSTSENQNIHLPIILMTSFTELWRIKAARDAGVNVILAKPISPAELYKRLVYVIEKPRDFVKTENYFGPDRRIDVAGLYDGEERREAKES